ncbi:MAG: hypothetical protein MJZ60_05390 [Bacteroidaceae bacterium]|nr:hypothetical protein [Bacteroidaceae bacterium]
MKKVYIVPCSVKYDLLTPKMFAISKNSDGATVNPDDFDNTGDQVIDGGDVKEGGLWDVEW